MPTKYERRKYQRKIRLRKQAARVWQAAAARADLILTRIVARIRSLKIRGLSTPRYYPQWYTI